jgi:hypothetical protein
MPGEKTSGGKAWRVSQLGKSRILAFEAPTDNNPEQKHGFAQCSAEMLYDFFVGINQRHWSGVAVVDTGFGVKKLYFKSGELVFASSDLIDDRLGEVIYREAIISLEQLTQFAVQVDRKTKFGKVLIASGRFSTIDLWHALKSQVREIFRSVFLAESTFVEIHAGTSPVEVNFESGTKPMLDAAFSFGMHFRSFAGRLIEDVCVSRVDEFKLGASEPGTFIGDMLELCSGSPLVGEVVEKSKLTKANTLVALQKLVAMGHLKLEGMASVDGIRMDAQFATLKSAIDAYQLLRDLVANAFVAANMLFPAADLTAFALTLNHDGAISIFLDPVGNLTTESISAMLLQCSSNSSRIEYFQSRIESLTKYLLLTSGDLLPFEAARELRAHFREITS